jgi:hypothetical protein
VAHVPVDESVRSVLRHYLGSDAAILRAHAVWAARRLGQSDLAELVRNDLDELVRAEWNVPVTSR